MNIFFSSKLLKEHESKYEPLGHDETFKIMEEILAMQIGINTEQVSFVFFNKFFFAYLDRSPAFLIF